MFVAMNQNGRRVNLLDVWNKDALRALQKEDQFFCPICHGEVQLKMGSYKKPHFAHKQMQCAAVGLEHESLYHLTGKRLLYEWFRKQGFTVELEPYLPVIAQRPDMLIISKETNIAVEYQCSSISPALLIKRTQAYWKEGIRVLWILGGNQLKRHNAYWYRLSSFHTLSSQYDEYPYLLYFCSRTSSFLRCSLLIPFSPVVSFAHTIFHPLHSASISSVLAAPVWTYETLQKQWNEKKKQWRQNALYAFHRTHPHFLGLLYQKGIPPSYFPSEAAVPLPSLLAVHTPALIWQFYVLDAIDQVQAGSYFSPLQIFSSLKRRGVLKERTLLYFPPAFFKKAFLEYIHFLCLAGYIEKISPHKYRRRKLFPRLHTEEEAIQRDEEVIKYAMRLFEQKRRATLEAEKRI
ncbi:MAG: competence protein CoiA family protein [Ectobacillus sp.]